MPEGTAAFLWMRSPLVANGQDQKGRRLVCETRAYWNPVCLGGYPDADPTGTRQGTSASGLPGRGQRDGCRTALDSGGARYQSPPPEHSPTARNQRRSSLIPLSCILKAPSAEHASRIRRGDVVMDECSRRRLALACSCTGKRTRPVLTALFTFGESPCVSEIVSAMVLCTQVLESPALYEATISDHEGLVHRLSEAPWPARGAAASGWWSRWLSSTQRLSGNGAPSTSTATSSPTCLRRR